MVSRLKWTASEGMGKFTASKINDVEVKSLCASSGERKGYSVVD